MQLSKSHLYNIKVFKSAILQSCHQAAALVYKELLVLYFAVGKFISRKIEEAKWGAKVIENLSSDLQLELPGLSGFSATNMKRMRLFLDSREDQFLISPLVSTKLETIHLQRFIFKLSVADKLENSFSKVSNGLVCRN